MVIRATTNPASSPAGTGAGEDCVFNMSTTTENTTVRHAATARFRKSRINHANGANTRKSWLNARLNSVIEIQSVMFAGKSIAFRTLKAGSSPMLNAAASRTETSVVVANRRGEI